MIACELNEANRLQLEVKKCRRSLPYFLDTYCRIYDATSGDWVPFRLWPFQFELAQSLQEHRLHCILKARQLGLTWEVLGYALWLMIFHPAATVLLFSRREEESVYLLGDERLRGMCSHLPLWMQPAPEEPDAARTWMLANRSVARAFPTNAGDSYTATLAIVDEADLVPDLDKLMRAVKPTIDGGGRMILLSRVDKSKPQSEFKRIYTAAKQGLTSWTPIFLPWHVRPERDAAWYEAQKADIFHRTGSLDDLHEQYPATDVEALAPRSLDKRLAPQWLQECYVELPPLDDRVLRNTEAPAIPGLNIYRVPQRDRYYVLGVDPAEGNPTSDDSAIEVLDGFTGEQMASLAGKFEPSTLAAHANALGRWYNHAALLVERNNHGHAVLLWLQENSPLRLLYGHDSNKGWLTNVKGKALLYDNAADYFRDGETVLHSLTTFTQLASIEGSTLRAPEGEHDDRAVAYALALMGLKKTCYSDDPGEPFILSRRAW